LIFDQPGVFFCAVLFYARLLFQASDVLRAFDVRVALRRSSGRASIPIDHETVASFSPGRIRGEALGVEPSAREICSAQAWSIQAFAINLPSL